MLLSFVRHGDFVGLFPSIACQGEPTVSLGISSLYDPESDLWQQHLRAWTSVTGADTMDVAIGSAGVRALFAEQKAVGLPCPGNTPTRMFGRDLRLSS